MRATWIMAGWAMAAGAGCGGVSATGAPPAAIATASSSAPASTPAQTAAAQPASSMVGNIDEPMSVHDISLAFFAITDDGDLEPWRVLDDVPLDDDGRFSVQVEGAIPDPLVVVSESDLGLRAAILDVCPPPAEPGATGTTPALVIPELGLESTVEAHTYLRARHFGRWLGRQPAVVVRTAVTPSLAEALAGSSDFLMVTDVVLGAVEVALHRANLALALTPEDSGEIYDAILAEMKSIHARMDLGLLESQSADAEVEVLSAGRRSLLNAFLAQGIGPEKVADAYVAIVETLAGYSQLATPEVVNLGGAAAPEPASSGPSRPL